MTPELSIPVGALILLTFVQTMLPATVRWFFSNYADGTKPTLFEAMGPRDRAPHMTSRFGQRAERAMANQIEALAMFAPALALVAAMQSAPLWAVWLFVGARTIYVPAYLFGIFGLRSAAWTAGLVATVLTWAAAL